MKNNIKTLSTFLLTATVISILGFNTIQQKTHKELITGAWIPEGCETCIWIFSNTGRCESHYEGTIYKSYNYEIFTEKSSDGKLTLYTLRLKNESNFEEVYEYDINSIGENHMTLDYLGGTRSINNLLRFKKE